MDKNNAEIEKSITSAIEEITPNVLPKILLQIEQQEKNQPVEVFSKHQGRKRSGMKWAGCAAAIFLLIFGFHFGYGYFLPETVISFDVNPSIELQVNRSEKVLSAKPLNEDAEVVLGSMDLKYVDLEIAVNAIIGSMVKNGYLSELKNSILISVDGKNDEKNMQLQQHLTNEVDELLKGFAVEGAVLSQTLIQDNKLTMLAEEYNISLGKAKLIMLLISQDETITFADLAPLSINDLNLLLTSKNTDTQEITSKGKASSNAYIGETNAKEIALKQSGESDAALISWEIEMDYDDGHMVYEVSLYTNYMEYEYEIDAITGEVLKFESEDEKAAVPPDLTDGYIGLERAKTIAVSHAGADESKLKKYDAEIKVKDNQKGAIYEVEFAYLGMEYEYEIDAMTGDILEWSTEPD